MAGPTLIMAGGTGGHIFPGLAVADALQAQDLPVCWLGTPQGLENQLVGAAGVPMLHVQVQALRGKGGLGWLMAPFKLARAVWQAVGVLRRVRPGCVLSMGGYVAGPGGVAARLLGVPLVVHEQNRRPGLTNRLLSGWAQRVCEGFAGTFPQQARVVHTGNPVREKIRALAAPAQRYQGRQGALRIVVLGGSLGARFLNQKVPEMLAHWPQDQRPEVLHQCGKRGVVETREAYQQHQVSARIEPFVDAMEAVYGWADLVICRAGALTVSELMAAGLPAVLVPFPHAVDDHQYANGEVLAEAGAALLIREADWDSAQLAKQLQQWQQRETLVAMAEAARRLDCGDAARHVAQICQEVAR